VPQIEVSFDLDANGIMNVSASDKSTGKTNKITITNDKGRLSQDDIERMVKEAERFKEEDERQRKKVDAKNALENYAYSLKNTMSEEKVADKLDASDKEALNKKIDESIKWLESNGNAEVEEFEAKQKELEGVAMPIMTKLYQSGGAPGGMPDMGGGMPGGGPPPSGGGAGGPHIEEVD
jgi:L1 cell adhesion molecule like protein